MSLHDAMEGQRRIKFNKWGLAEDPRGLHAVWSQGGRDYLCEIMEVFRTGGYNDRLMLRTRHLSGEEGPTVAASAVRVLVRSYESTAEYLARTAREIYK